MKILPIATALLLASCRTPEAATLASEDGAVVGDAPAVPLIEQIDQAGVDATSHPHILPSDLWTKIGEGPGGKSARVAMLAELLKATAAKLKGVDFPTVLHESFGISGFSAMTLTANALDEYLKTDPTRLDRFPTLPLSEIPKVQAQLFGDTPPDLTAPETRPFPAAMVMDGEEIVLADAGCAPFKAPWTAAIPKSGLYKGGEGVDKLVVPCFRENSKQLAMLLNRLSNNAFGEAPDVSVRIRAEDGDDAADETLESHEELAQLLEAQGFTVEIYQTRTVAPFFEASFREGASAVFRSLRMNLWIRTEVDDQPVRLPAEQGELGFLVHRDGKRYAAATFLLGQPDPKLQSVGSYWRADDLKRPRWRAAVRERVETFRGYQLKGVVPWLDSVAGAMRGFQGVFDRYHLPFNTYSMFVCADSLVMAAAQRQVRAGALKGRSTNIFPIVRAPIAERVAAEKGNLPLVALRAAYPADPDLEGSEPRRFRDRLRTAFPATLDERFGAFPELKKTLELIRTVTILP